MSQFTRPKLANGKQPDQNPQSLQKQGNDKTMTSPIQKIFFGCPGTGKSYQISNDDLGGVVKEELGIDKDVHAENLIKTVFHPEYTYGDFMGKLMPQTNKDGNVYYQFYEGHFLKALGQAYKNIIDAKEGELPQNVALVIDEINRGNSSAIFGTVFQLLDRLDQPKNGIEKGWSAYGINISDLEFRKLVELMGFTNETVDSNKDIVYKYQDKGSLQELVQFPDIFNKIHIKVHKSKAVGSSIRIPPNLSIFGTMNTSDNSIYFMDNAFKRRWEWEYVDWSQDDDKKLDTVILEGYGNGNLKWKDLVKQFNDFIKDNHNSVRSGRIEDMQIGYRFINTGKVTEDQIKNKLMFFIWDSVFNRDKNPLRELLGFDKNDKQLVTFGDFIKSHKEFVEKLLDYKPK
ncbi:restriction endonuclease [Dolichospermum circinale CS-1225]|uniref:restriction endonuclease n=1 Tax=Dolichospermum circinale TaxID=109265 RepID=UPI00042758D4|nr:restriction endonuclease [Dolichospermum circinale]MDB9523167.1 restriction endonuclease [Dolichospermum circinale CS-1225]